MSRYLLSCKTEKQHGINPLSWLLMLISRIVKILRAHLYGKRNFKLPIKVVYGAVVIFLVYTGFSWLAEPEKPLQSPVQPQRQIEQTQNRIIEGVSINRVEDGDTLTITWGSKTERLRLIGLDTPEVYNAQKMKRDAKRLGISENEVLKKGQLASLFVKEYLKSNYADQAIRLELGIEERDKYGRLLGYVWLQDGKLLNEEIIRAGYGTSMVIPPNSKYYKRFKSLERQAKKQHIGIWSSK